MRVRSMAILVLTAAASFGVPTFAHHSQSLFDTTKEILVEGTVARFDWKNPHMYLIVETKGPKGEKVLVEGEGLAITQALVDGLRREALMPGTPVVMRANPNKGGPGHSMRRIPATARWPRPRVSRGIGPPTVLLWELHSGPWRVFPSHQKPVLPNRS